MATLQDIMIQLRRLKQTGFDQLLSQQAQLTALRLVFLCHRQPRNQLRE